MSYKKGEVGFGSKYDDDYNVIGKVIELPHSYDEWVIGGVEEAKMMIEDLQEAIEKLNAKAEGEEYGDNSPIDDTDSGMMEE